jgi:hypothetical protein
LERTADELRLLDGTLRYYVAWPAFKFANLSSWYYLCSSRRRGAPPKKLWLSLSDFVYHWVYVMASPSVGSIAGRSILRVASSNERTAAQIGK